MRIGFTGYSCAAAVDAVVAVVRPGDAALYVTEHTVDLGEEGARALQVLEQTGREAGALPDGLPRLRVLA